MSLPPFSSKATRLARGPASAQCRLQRPCGAAPLAGSSSRENSLRSRESAGNSASFGQYEHRKGLGFEGLAGKFPARASREFFAREQGIFRAGREFSRRRRKARTSASDDYPDNSSSADERRLRFRLFASC